jgi:hypothetical protein
MLRDVGLMVRDCPDEVAGLPTEINLCAGRGLEIQIIDDLARLHCYHRLEKVTMPKKTPSAEYIVKNLRSRQRNYWIYSWRFTRGTEETPCFAVHYGKLMKFELLFR